MAKGFQTERQIRRAIWKTVTNGLPAVITSHVRLDGDGIGSTLALWHALKQSGVEAEAILCRPVPSMFAFLPGLDDACSDAAQLPADYNLVVLDCGALERVCWLSEAPRKPACTINIDHHEGNTLFGDLNWVDPSASSCGEMVCALLEEVGVSLTQQAAECLFTAVVSDTGQFSHDDTTAAAFRTCARCIEAGARPDQLIRRLFMSPSPAQVRLQHMALGTLKFHCGGRIATMEVTQQMCQKAGVDLSETEGFAELPIMIQGVEASALLKEMPGSGYTKVSLRSKNAVDVRSVAAAFGGGGHQHAAGCEVHGSLSKVRQEVVGRLQLQLRRTSAP